MCLVSQSVTLSPPVCSQGVSSQSVCHPVTSSLLTRCVQSVSLSPCHLQSPHKVCLVSQSVTLSPPVSSQGVSSQSVCHPVISSLLTRCVQSVSLSPCHLQSPHKVCLVSQSVTLSSPVSSQGVSSQSVCHPVISSLLTRCVQSVSLSPCHLQSPHKVCLVSQSVTLSSPVSSQGVSSQSVCHPVTSSLLTRCV